MVENSFFEHWGLIGGFVLVAWYDLRERLSGSTGDRDGRTDASG
jgi:hypothetical protein